MRFRALVVGIVAFSLTGSARAGNPWTPWLEIGAQGSSELSYGELNLFLPWGNDTTLGFLDLRTKIFTEDFDSDELEANAALGIRHMWGDTWNLGAWVGADSRRTEANNHFVQISTGLEALSANWDLRFNGYAPISDAKDVDFGSADVELSGSSIFMTGGQEVPLYGVDGEIGWRVPLERWDTDQMGHLANELRVFAGGFHFDDDDAEEDVTGPRLRAEWRLLDVIPGLPGSRLTVGFEFQYDDVRNDQWKGGLQLRIPLGGWSRTSDSTEVASQRRRRLRMTERIVRDVDILAGDSEREQVEDALSGTRFDRVVHADATSDVNPVAAGAGANSLVIVDGAPGEIQGGQVMPDRQTWLGRGTAIAVRGADTGALGLVRAPGARPTVRLRPPPGTMNDIGILMNDGSHVAGFRVIGNLPNGDPEQPAPAGTSSETGIEIAAGSRRAYVSQANVVNTGDRGIAAENFASHVGIYDVFIRQNGDEAIDMEPGVSNIVIERVVIHDYDEEGIDLSGRNRNVRIHDVEIRNGSEEGIQVFADGPQDEGATNLHISNVRTYDTDEEGLDFGGTAIHRNVLVEDYIITNAGRGPNASGDEALRFSSNAENMTIRRLAVRGGTLNSPGMLVSGDNNEITFEDLRLEGDFASEVIRFEGSNNRITGTGTFDGTFGTVFCDDNGGTNPDSNIQFGGGLSCP